MCYVDLKRDNHSADCRASHTVKDTSRHVRLDDVHSVCHKNPQRVAELQRALPQWDTLAALLFDSASIYLRGGRLLRNFKFRGGVCLHYILSCSGVTTIDIIDKHGQFKSILF